MRILLTLTSILILGACSADDHQTNSPAMVSHTEAYLPVELGTRVAQLKADVASDPTNASNVQDRATTLYEWANAFSLHHGSIPDELMSAVGSGIGGEGGANVYEAVDNYVYELSLREADSDAIGSLAAYPMGPFPADSHVTFAQTYTAGSTPIQEGGGIMIAIRTAEAYPQAQAVDPIAENYVSVSSSNSEARFSLDSVPLAGMHGGFLTGAAGMLVFRLEGTNLQSGETITVVYGDTSQGSPGFRMQTFSNDIGPFPLFVDLDGTDRFLTLPMQPIQISGTDVAGVHGFAPSIVATGQEFDVSIRFEDRISNLALAPFPDLEILLNDEHFQTIENISEGIILLEDITISVPGVYRFSFRTAEFTGVANPILVQSNPGERIYWGDTHGHSGMAEGLGSADGFMRFARDEARLDFVTHSEHDKWMDDSEWMELRENASKYTKEGEFIAFLGYEWTMSPSSGGHHNVLFRTPEQRQRIPSQTFRTLSKLYYGLKLHNDPRDVLSIPHAHQVADYRLTDPELEHLIEIMSGHGTFEWFGRKYLEHGHRVGFIAASDDHLGHPGYSVPTLPSNAQRGGLGAVFATGKTTDALFDAMKSRRTYATTGDRIILFAEVNGQPMGTSTEYAEDRTISGRVIGTAPIDTITIVKNGEEIWTQQYLSDLSGTGEPSNLQLSFSSDSAPYHPGDNPRGWVTWKGSLEVKGADLISFSGTDHNDPLTQSIRQSETNPNLLVFSTQSKGDATSLDLRLDNIGPNATVELRLDAAQEIGTRQMYRSLGNLPAWDIDFSLQELTQGVTNETREYQAWNDSVSLRRVVENGILETNFEFLDSDSPRQGDNYYVRVKQANDAYAWSSPVWVGGHETK